MCLTEQGVEESRLIGSVFRLLDVKVARVVASPSCRAKETAQYAFGRIDGIDNSLLHRTAIPPEQWDGFAAQLRSLILSIDVQPGTYVLTDFLVLSFDRLVWRELGLDRHPELLDDYFRHYSRVVWLAGRRTPDMERAAQRAADRLGLPLDIIAAPGRLTQTLDNLFTP